MQEAFANALRRGQGVQARCLGLNLQTLQVGHLFLLEEHECAFPYRFEEHRDGDLVIGVLICSQSWKASRKNLKAWWMPFYVQLWERLTRRHSTEEAAEIFQMYLCREMTAPETEGPGTAELKAPLPFRLLAMLMADFHITEEKAMDMPVKKAMCLWATEGDRRGTVSLVSERQLNFRKWVEEQERIRLANESKEAA